jgi:UDP-N-acetylmuramoylalanine--D-glutamate ligase
VYEGKIVIKAETGKEIYLCRVSELLIPGMHNLENALAAAAIGYFVGVPTEAIILALTSFAGVEHRIEFVCEKYGVRYVNDSKGTNPEASIKAIEATDTPILLIAGGYEKHSDFDAFIKAFNGKVKYLFVLGVTAPRIAQSAVKLDFPKDRILFCEDMKECVQKAYAFSVVGDTVLLSPACASWGMYKNFEERGKDFKQLALSIVH